MKKTVSVLDIILLVLSLALCLGSAFVFHPCGPMEDGGWMRCHWAGVVVTGLGAVLSIITVARLFLRDGKIALGTDIAIIPAAVLALLMPGVLIQLCGMKTMRCHTVTRPATIVLAVLIIVAAVIDVIILLKKQKAERA